MRRISAFFIATPVLLFALVVLILAACTPTWMPDSKSFIYTSNGREILVRDIVNKSSKRIVTLEANTGNAIIQVGVRSDGKQIAIIESNISKTMPSASFSIFDLTGKLIHKSPEIDLSDITRRESDNLRFDYCHWGGQKYLVGSLPTMSCMISYDIEKREHRIYEKAIPLAMATNEMAPWTDIPTTSPTGNAFVAIIDNDPMVVALPKGDPKPFTTPDDRQGLDLGPPTNTGTVRLPGYWEKDSFILPINFGEVRLDTKTRAMSIRKTPRMKQLFDHAVETKSVVLGDLSKDWIFEAVKKEKSKSNQGFLVRFYNLKNKEMKQLHPSESLSTAITPSPDKKHSLVFSFSQGASYYVVDGEGNVVDKVENVVPQLPPRPKQPTE